MSILRTATTAATVARTVLRSPAVRAGLALAPALLANPVVRERARELTLGAAYGAGVVARRIVKGR